MQFQSRFLRLCGFIESISLIARCNFLPPRGAGPPFPSSQLPRVPRPCRVFCDRAGTLTSYPHHDSRVGHLNEQVKCGFVFNTEPESILVKCMEKSRAQLGKILQPPAKAGGFCLVLLDVSQQRQDWAESDDLQ
jgi:hypothetical protein